MCAVICADLIPDFFRNRLYRRSYNEKNERADAERQSEPERQHFDCAARDGKRIPRKRCRVRDRFRGNRDIHGCVGCVGYFTTGKCVFTDIANELTPKFKVGVSIACARCGIHLGKEQFGLPAQEEWMPTHFIRRGNRNGGKVTDFRKAEIWLLGYPGILGSISQAERREVCSQGGIPNLWRR